MRKARIVLIHGRAQQGKSEEILKNEWLSPLREALGTRARVLDECEVRAPFYGDTLAELVETLGDAVPDDIIVRGTDEGIDNSYRNLLAEHLEVVREQEGITEEQILAEANLLVTQRGPQNWPWVLAIVRTLNRIPGLDGDMIERILRDVWIYLERRSVRKTINAIVAPAFETDLPIVVVAHSLGSIVAYDILRDMTGRNVSHLLTVGSPLGLEIARKALSPIGHPTVVGSWFNSRDKRDIVALYPLDKQYFKIDPAIEDYSGVRNRTSNAHGIRGYLSDTVTVDRLYAALRRATE